MSAVILSGFLMGLFGGAHCMTMCGGIAGVVCGGAGRLRASERSDAMGHRWPLGLLYNVGRVASYVVAGALLGLFGSVALIDARLDVMRYLLRTLAALSMLVAGLYLLGLPSPLGHGVGRSLWRQVAPLAKRLLPAARPLDALFLGLLWGLMPCGLLYGAFALAASAQSPGEGGLTMLAFGGGTLPVMLTVGAFAQTCARWLARKVVRRFAGAVILAFGLVAIAGLARQVGLGAVFGERPCCAHANVSTGRTSR